MNKVNYFSSILFSFILIFLLAACSNEETTANDESILSNEWITVSPEQFKMAEMKIGTLTLQPFEKVIKTNGIIDVPPENKSSISTYFGGYVKQIKLLQGQKVKKGETLFLLENPEFVEVQQEFLEIKNQLAYLKSDYERQKKLAKDNINSQKVFLKAESDYNIAISKHKALEKKLKLMGLSPTNVKANYLKSSIPVKAPISGYVTTINISNGMFLSPENIAIEIVNTNNIHIELNIFEQDLVYIKEGQKVNFSLQNSGAFYQAKVHLINKIIDPETRTINVHCDLENTDESHLFTPGMFVEAEIITTSDSVFALPESAIISEEDTFYTLIKVNSKSADIFEFEQKKVEVGAYNNGFYEIINHSDFNENTQFLVEGGFNLIGE